jgi:transcription-repair coupling factor (superfamily II helicase)
MLEEAVADLRAGSKRAREAEGKFTPQINLGLPVLIPENYVQELPVRLGLYRRIGGLETEAEVEAIAAEFADRFGPIPPEVENLLQVVGLKLQCRAAGVEKVDAGPKGVVIAFHKNRFANPAGLVAWVSGQKGLVSLRPDHKLALLRELPFDARVKAARGLVANLVRVVEQAKAA